MRIESEEEAAAWDQYAASALVAFGAVDIAVAVREITYTPLTIGPPMSAGQIASVAAGIADALMVERRRRIAGPNPPIHPETSVKEVRHGTSSSL
ncbi:MULTISPECIES: hypothetical protein [Pseudomonas]|uniref:hypothetical protein n=1 Tax=Pseudomonas TaxID=286 RepID=UPI001C8042DC|nr:MULTISPECIES: hypothetical protein [Pseudomonas]MDH0896164.1 hypothetical protein [Pseudomonas sp. GD03875]MDH1066022.1 hypothetical protein [Pseudomonas sp. GD03985]